MAVQAEVTNSLPPQDDTPLLAKQLSASQKKTTVLTGRLQDSSHMDHSLAVVKGIPCSSTVIDLLSLKGKQVDQAIFKLASDMFPEWISGALSLTIERVSGALTNAVFFVSVNPNKRMLLRVYGIGCQYMIQRKNELLWLTRLSHLHLGPRLLGTFGNGRFEEYLPSTTLSRSDIREPALSKQIANQLSRLHHIIHIFPPPHAAPLAVWTHVDLWFSRVKQMLPDLLRNSRHRAALKLLDLERLGREISAAKAILKTVKSPIVFCHNDTQYGNILQLHTTGKLVIVDFEYAGYNPRGFDLANHFCEWMYNYHGDTPAAMERDKYPTYSEQRRFLSAYLERCEDGTTMEQLFFEATLWRMAVHLQWGLWGLLQATQSEIDFDYVSYAIERIHAFRSDLLLWA